MPHDDNIQEPVPEEADQPVVAASILPHRTIKPSVERAKSLSQQYDGIQAQELIRQLIEDSFKGRIALVSSFGADAAVLLHMVAQVDKETPVLFLETGMLFTETLKYQRDIAQHLGLKNVHLIRPATDVINSVDPDGVLHQSEPDRCCHVRKTLPLQRALAPYNVWITGRKRFQSNRRAKMSLFEADEDNRVKVNPLIDWIPDDVRAYMDAHNLPRHPLIARGYPSIGCAPCTSPVRKGEDPRAGRWRGQDKDECGIHFVNGKVVRGPLPSADSSPNKKEEAPYARYR